MINPKREYFKCWFYEVISEDLFNLCSSKITSENEQKNRHKSDYINDYFKPKMYKLTKKDDKHKNTLNYQPISNEHLYC